MRVGLFFLFSSFSLSACYRVIFPSHVRVVFSACVDSFKEKAHRHCGSCVRKPTKLSSGNQTAAVNKQLCGSLDTKLDLTHIYAQLHVCRTQ